MQILAADNMLSKWADALGRRPSTLESFARVRQKQQEHNSCYERFKQADGLTPLVLQIFTAARERVRAQAGAQASDKAPGNAPLQRKRRVTLSKAGKQNSECRKQMGEATKADVQIRRTGYTGA
jgi:hypothetical protein